MTDTEGTIPMTFKRANERALKTKDLAEAERIMLSKNGLQP